MTRITWKTSHIQRGTDGTQLENVRCFLMDWQDFVQNDEHVPAVVEKRIHPRPTVWAEEPIEKTHRISLDKKEIEERAFAYEPETQIELRSAIEVAVQELFKNWDKKNAPPA